MSGEDVCKATGLSCIGCSFSCNSRVSPNETIIKQRRTKGVCEQCKEELGFFQKFRYCPYCGRKIARIDRENTIKKIPVDLEDVLR